jgi:hypothetical protein
MRGGIVSRPEPDIKLMTPGGRALAKASTIQIIHDGRLITMSRIEWQHTKVGLLLLYLLERRWAKPPTVGIFIMTTFPMRRAGMRVA